ncbi:uncharacterized protein LOC128233883 [Mya arenaria]|nr:uncharacterized protein LOC128233883 [Mya arenaria]
MSSMDTNKACVAVLILLIGGIKAYIYKDNVRTNTITHSAHETVSFATIQIADNNVDVLQRKETNPKIRSNGRVRKSWIWNNTETAKTNGVQKANTHGFDMYVPKTAKCNISVTRRSVNRFRHLVYREQSNYVYLKLIPALESGITLTKGKWIISENIWIWTFWGKEGAVEFLKWPREFGVWSMGLLYEYVYREPIEITLKRDHGNCSNLEVGNKNDDQIIADALLNLSLEMMSLNKDKYGPSYFCYAKRKIIEPYILCKHIVCPIEGVTHSCCNYVYNQSKGGRVMQCKEVEFDYDDTWWIYPSVVSIVLFIYSPIFFMFVLYKCSERKTGRIRLSVLQELVGNINTEPDDSETHEHDPEECILFEDVKHVTLQNTICMPFTAFKSDSVCLTNCFNCLVKLITPVLSLFVIGMQIFVDYNLLYGFVIDCVDSGVPMGFRSILTGYRKSKHNFLPYVGGPYVALSCYVGVTWVMVVSTSSISRLLCNAVAEKRLENHELESSPLFLSLRNVSIFGTVTIEGSKGFRRLYNLFLGQFYMILNSKFWKHIFHIQTSRWYKCTRKIMLFPLFPLYLVFCALEILLSLFFYGMPMVSFGYIVIKAYCLHFGRGLKRTCGNSICMNIFTICIIFAVLYFLLMFATIFSDATTLFTRVIFFTFTGLIVFPKTAYGYIIFCFTVFYYLWESFNDFSLLYTRLFKDIIRLTKSIQRANANNNKKVLFKHNQKWGIRESLFELVIENHCPRRKLLFTTLLRAFVVLGLLGICINMLLKTDNFRELHVIMHVGTALFICALPQIVKRVCNKGDSYSVITHHKKALVVTIKSYLGYFDEDYDTDSGGSV